MTPVARALHERLISAGTVVVIGFAAVFSIASTGCPWLSASTAPDGSIRETGIRGSLSWPSPARLMITSKPCRGDPDYRRRPHRSGPRWFAQSVPGGSGPRRRHGVTARGTGGRKRRVQGDRATKFCLKKVRLGRTDDRSVQPVSLVVADRRPLLLRFLEYICSDEPGFQVVAACARADTALETLRLRRPDVLIVDAILPPTGGIGVLRQIRRERLPTRAVLLADAADERHVLEAVQLGFGGIVLRDMTPHALLQCVRKVHAGERCVDRHALPQLVDRRSGAEEEIREFDLTPRQMEIVRLASEAISTKEIAARLMVTEGTVKVHLHNIYGKLQVDGRIALMLLMMKQGLL
jgi:DNA-binding NarL/FixJ family response regulator